MTFFMSMVMVHEFNDAADNVYDIGKQIRHLADSMENIVGVELLFPGAQMDSMLLLGEVSKCRRDISVFGGYPMGHDMGDYVLKELYVKVDDALYVAKNIGRNCVVAAEC